jgi:MFS family permease
LSWFGFHIILLGGVVKVDRSTNDRSMPSGISENALVMVLTLTFGIVMVDRLALNYLAPYVVRDLGLSNTQLGAVATGVSVSLALSGIVGGVLCDRYGRRKLLLVFAIIGFSISSFLTGFATSFLMLVGARILLGLFEGPVLPISQVLLARLSSPHRRGLNMGIMQSFGANILGIALTPILMVAIAEYAGWRAAFFLAGVPGLLCALLVWVTLRGIEDSGKVAVIEQASSWRALAGTRNIPICIAITGCLVGWALLSFVFLPLILTQHFNFSTSTMGLLMSAVGGAAVLAGFLIPALSDRFGRKPIIPIAAAVGLVAPIGVMLSDGSLLILSITLFIGFFAAGLTSVVMATIPVESVGVLHITTAVGLVFGIGETLAGLIGPLLGGILADRYGLMATLWLQTGLLIIVAALSTLLSETAPASKLRAN